MDIILDYVIDKFALENGISVICDFKIGQEIVELIEDVLGYTVDEDNFNVLADKNNKYFIITKNDEEIFIENLYDEDGKVKIHECSYLYVQDNILTENEIGLITGHKEKKILVVYNK